MTDLTIELKLSSRITMSLASCATAVPAMPMLSPTSASLRAGASLVPSPVTATTSPISLSLCTSTSLSRGLALASTWTPGRTLLWAWGSSARNSPPSMALPLVKMPASLAMLLAVMTLSPVTIRTVMPAFWHRRTAAGTSFRTGSWIPKTPMRVRPSEGGASGLSFSGEGRSIDAMVMVRSARLAILVMYCSTLFLSSSGNLSTSPRAFM
mmetsp:Transcript_30056/g.70193  ORF Transcript_30056/g.70193 Transcript_30056/m.70193 type:complete len:210 (+) Transcript_30056:1012-1641(+)